MMMIIGVFIDSKGISGASQQVSDIITWGQWSLVQLVVVGNEAVFNGYCSTSELASFISSVKSSFANAGYHGPCTTTEPVNIIQQWGSAICDVVDVMGSNVHPFFNPSVSADKAGDFIKGQYEIIGAICPGKEVFILETGWPHAGNSNGQACPGDAEQITAFTSIIEAVGKSAVMFSYSNDAWKAPGPYAVEQYWGCADIFH